MGKGQAHKACKCITANTRLSVICCSVSLFTHSFVPQLHCSVRRAVRVDDLIKINWRDCRRTMRETGLLLVAQQRGRCAASAKSLSWGARHESKPVRVPGERLRFCCVFLRASVFRVFPSVRVLQHARTRSDCLLQRLSSVRA